MVLGSEENSDRKSKPDAGAIAVTVKAAATLHRVVNRAILAMMLCGLDAVPEAGYCRMRNIYACKTVNAGCPAPCRVSDGLPLQLRVEYG